METQVVDNLGMAVRLLRTVIDDFDKELTPTLKYDLWLRLNFVMEHLERIERDAKVGDSKAEVSIRVC